MLTEGRFCPHAKLELFNWKSSKKKKNKAEQKTTAEVPEKQSFQYWEQSTWALNRVSLRHEDTSAISQITSIYETVLIWFYSKWDLRKGTSRDTLIFLGSYALALVTAPAELLPFPHLFNPPGLDAHWIWWFWSIHSSSARREDQASTFPMSFMTPVTNQFPQESLFLSPFCISIPAGHSPQKKKAAQAARWKKPRACDKASQKLTQPWDASQFCHLQTKATRKQITEVFPFHFWICPGHYWLFTDLQR